MRPSSVEVVALGTSGHLFCVDGDDIADRVDTLLAAGTDSASIASIR